MNVKTTTAPDAADRTRHLPHEPPEQECGEDEAGEAGRDAERVLGDARGHRDGRQGLEERELERHLEGAPKTGTFGCSRSMPSSWKMRAVQAVCVWRNACFSSNGASSVGAT